VVEQIVGDPELLSRRRANALRFARDRFNWQVQSQTLYELYRSAVGVEHTMSSGAVAKAATCPGAWGGSP
jgi:hypothetical protein